MTGNRRIDSLLRVTCALVLASGLSLPSFPQDATLPSEVVEKVEVRRIEFPILARDKDGQPVSDLRPEEISVTIRRKPARVAYLEAAVRSLDPGVTRPVVQLSVDGGEISGTTPHPGRTPRAVILFIDGGLTAPKAREDGPSVLREFLKETLGGSDLAAVFSYGTEFRLESAFTSNKQRLMEAVDHAFENRLPRPVPVGTRMRQLVRKLELCIETEIEESGQSRGLPGEPSMINPSDLRPRPNCLKFAAGAYIEERQRSGVRLMAAMEETLRYARGLDGPVTIYALTHGATLEPEREFWEAVRAVFGHTPELDQLGQQMPQSSNTHLLTQLAETAENERVSFAFLDPTIRPAGHISAAMRGMHQAGTRPVEVAYLQAQQFAREIARDTGSVFIEERDLDKGLKELARLEDGRFFLGVVPPEGFKPGQSVSRVRMKCSRPGVTLTHGRGAGYRTPDSGDLRARIGLPAVGQTAPDDRGLVTRPYTVGFRAADLEYVRVKEDAVAEMTLHLRVETLEGEFLAHVFHDLHHVVPAGGENAPGILTVRGTLEAPPGSYRLVAFLRSLNSELRTTVFREINVP